MITAIAIPLAQKSDKFLVSVQENGARKITFVTTEEGAHKIAGVINTFATSVLVEGD